MTVATKRKRRRLTPFTRAVMESRAEHLASLLKRFPDMDINCAQDFRMLIELAMNSGIRQCDIARLTNTRRSKVSRWVSGQCVARAQSERQQVADAIRRLLERKLDHASRWISLPQPDGEEQPISRGHPDMVLERG